MILRYAKARGKEIRHPALSPDGTRIAYFDGKGDHSHSLWVANADGTERRALLDDEFSGAGHMRALTWSPDGGWLAFTTDDSLYLVRPDGAALRRVVSGDFVTAPAVQWSRDGSRIAYLRERGTCFSSTGKDEDFICEAGRLVIVNVDGGDEQVIEGIRTPGNALDRLEPKGVIRSSARRAVTVAMTTLITGCSASPELRPTSAEPTSKVDRDAHGKLLWR